MPKFSHDKKLRPLPNNAQEGRGCVFLLLREKYITSGVGAWTRFRQVLERQRQLYTADD